ncbi:hypothetical protein GQ42DRAFT_174416 [Ramicandelaber brevisporus]|nr:hypothetical protein GQ42DRAFT_174416 [Ramicandelaber brevisporus]
MFAVVFVASQLLAFAYALLHFLYTTHSHRMHLGWAFAVAKASGFVLHIQVGLVMLPMCRTLLTWLRSTPMHHIMDFSSAATFHRLIGWSMVFFTAIHAVAHYYNYATLIPDHDDSDPSTSAVAKWLGMAFGSGPGATGHAMLLLLVIVGITSLARVRRFKFEAFWYTHCLFVPFLSAFSLHGGLCFFQLTSSADPSAEPQQCQPSVFWIFWVASGAIYAIERILREVRSFCPITITRIIQHPSSVIEIQFRPSGILSRLGIYNFKPSQYVFINCPDISLQQWHPFTLTSAPGNEIMSVHVRVVGDFTKALAERLGAVLPPSSSSSSEVETTDSEKAHPPVQLYVSRPASRDITNTLQIESTGTSGYSQRMPFIFIDGPFGAASEDVFGYEIVLLIGAGIGATPFASVLKSILQHKSNPGLAPKSKLHKVYFQWICRAIEHFEWFSDLLQSIEANDYGDFIDIQTYITAKFDPKVIANLLINTTGQYDADADAITGLRKSQTNFGRPNFNQVFQQMCERHSGQKIGVFVCGNKALTKAVKDCCSKHNRNHANGTKFYYYRERF